jgi:hypothetical protein
LGCESGAFSVEADERCAAPPEARVRPMSKRFRVAFTFAGEKRPFVAEVARLLAERFGEERILYDAYHEAEFARSDLAFKLRGFYFEEADLIVAVLCRDYDTREWCGLEWQAIGGLFKQRKAEDVMLCRFDRAEDKWLFGLAGFIDLDNKTPTEAALLILQRLAFNEGRKKDYYADAPAKEAGPDWPRIAPSLSWQLANQSAAQDAFARLITRVGPSRLLCIRGDSATGKSLFTQQLLSNVRRNLPSVMCGHFDFKGSADVDQEIGWLTKHLKITESPSEGAGFARRLEYIIGVLRGRARPTLLIFDTFEMAGGAEHWIEASLLPKMTHPSYAWLRVVIAGQMVPGKHGKPWAGICELVKLQTPSAEEWYDYARSFNPGIPLEFVTMAHAACGGRNAVLAQLLGARA